MKERPAWAIELVGGKNKRQDSAARPRRKWRGVRGAMYEWNYAFCAHYALDLAPAYNTRKTPRSGHEHLREPPQGTARPRHTTRRLQRQVCCITLYNPNQKQGTGQLGSCFSTHRLQVLERARSLRCLPRTLASQLAAWTDLSLF